MKGNEQFNKLETVIDSVDKNLTAVVVETKNELANKFMNLDAKMTQFLDYMEQKLQNITNRIDFMESGDVLRKYTETTVQAASNRLAKVI